MKRVLVTGAAGFIGYKTGLFFKNAGYSVIGWDRNNDKAREFDIIGLDMMNVEDVELQLKQYNPDIIIHCAGCADVGQSVKNPHMDYTGNVTLTHNLLFSLHRLGMNGVRVVFLSSAAVYGNVLSLPIRENVELNPLSPYALHKVMCEEMCRYFHQNHGMDIKIARVFSAYGAGLKKQIFWDMFNKASNGALNMFGTGRETRDYIHVNDVINVLYLIGTVNTKVFVFNVANGEEITIKQAAETFAKNVGINTEKVTFNNIVREGDPLNWKANIDRIKELGYQQKIKFAEGIKEYVDWCRTMEN